MGNAKGTQNITDIAIASRRRSTQNTNNSIKLTKVSESLKSVELSERDIAFLCSQTGNYFIINRFNSSSYKLIQ